jgi:hypothetical protein
MTTEKLFVPTYDAVLTEAVKNLAVDSGIVSSSVFTGGNTLDDKTKNWEPHGLEH